MTSCTQSFLVVGFVAYRVRQLRDGCLVPEVLPLGTFSWSVARDPTLLPKAWFMNNQKMSVAAPAKRQRRDDDGQILRYDVTSTYTDAVPNIYAFTVPSTMFPCTSALSTLIHSYSMLCHKRDCTVRADMYNSKPSIVFEEQNRSNPTDGAQRGVGLENNSDEQTSALRFVHLGAS